MDSMVYYHHIVLFSVKSEFSYILKIVYLFITHHNDQ